MVDPDDELLDPHATPPPPGPLGDLVDEPTYGYFPWWPENGDTWVHPEDVALARQMIPSDRIWRRQGQGQAYFTLRYGPLSLRVRSALWCEVTTEGLEVGDLVEVRSHGGRNDPVTGAIRDMLWDAHEGRITYRLTVAGMPHPRAFTAADLKHVDPAQREAFVRVEPKGDDGVGLELEGE